MPNDQITDASPRPDTQLATPVTATIEVCRICLDSAATLADKLSSLTRIEPTLAKAAVMAEPDLCIGCCIEIGRQAWISTKRSMGDSESTAALLKSRIELSKMVRP